MSPNKVPANDTAAADSFNQVCTVRIELLETDPLIWREVEVSTSITLKVLHDRRAPHILGVRIPGGMPPGLLDALAAEGVFCSDRLGVLRVSPHTWCREDDPDRFREALGRALVRG